MDTSALLVSLGHNVTLLLALVFIYDLVLHSSRLIKSQCFRVIEGLAFGLFSILAMMTSIVVAPGHLLDTRNVVVFIAGVFSGPIAAAVAGSMAILYRLTVGGDGVWSAIVVITCSSLFGISLYWYGRRSGRRAGYWPAPVAGLIIALNALLWTGLIGGTGGQRIVQDTAVPMIALYPITTLLLWVMLTHRDQLVKTETALRESEERYRTGISALQEGLIYQTAADGFVHCNASAERILGDSQEQIKQAMAAGVPVPVVHEDGSPVLSGDHPAEVAMRTGKPQTNVIVGFDDAKRGRIWLSVNASPLFADGDRSKPYAVLSTFTDITERRQSQSRLTSERDMLRTLIDNIPDYIFIKDSQGRFVISNAAHNQVAGARHADALVGQSAYDTFPPEMASQFDTDDRMVLQGERLVNVERTSLDLQGNPCCMLTTKVPLQDSSGQIVGLVGISRNITHRKKLEEQTLQLAAERQRVAVLHHVIGDISHDFRTPLTLINTSTELIRKHTDPQKREIHLQRIEGQTTRIMTLLNELVEIADLETNNFACDCHPVDMLSLLTDLMQAFVPLAEAKQLKLLFQPAVANVVVTGDARLLQRAVANLLENAVRHTPKGQITMTLECRAGELVIAVKDDGPGIAAAEQERIFEHFYRADEARPMASGGAGLGLSISRKIIEAHAGTIRVQSELGHGSTFIATLPLNSDDRHPVADAAGSTANSG